VAVASPPDVTVAAAAASAPNVEGGSSERGDSEAAGDALPIEAVLPNRAAAADAVGASGTAGAVAASVGADSASSKYKTRSSTRLFALNRR